MAKKLSPNQKRCEDCDNLIIENGEWKCEECFKQSVADIDDCPIGCTLEILQEMEENAKDVKIIGKSDKPRAKTVRERKPDLEKEEIIKNIADFLENSAENVKITNISKIIEFDIGENHFKLDLIRQRKPKK